VAGVRDRWIPSHIYFPFRQPRCINWRSTSAYCLAAASIAYIYPFPSFHTDAASCLGRQIPTPSLLFRAIWTSDYGLATFVALIYERIILISPSFTLSGKHCAWRQSGK
jgi:hypothetical protein